MKDLIFLREEKPHTNFEQQQAIHSYSHQGTGLFILDPDASCDPSSTQTTSSLDQIAQIIITSEVH